MQRLGDPGREARLQEWSAKLELKERQLDLAMHRFRDEMAVNTAKLVELQRDIAKRSAEVQKREEEVRQREAAVLEILRRAAEHAKDELADLEADEDGNEANAAVSSPAARSSSAGRHHDPMKTSEQASANTTLALFPKLSIPPLGIRKSLDPAEATATPSRGGGGDTHDNRSVSPAMYEGIVDRNQPSHVEDISDNESTPTPRGLRSSPQFRPMDPNDSGLEFFRRRMSTTVDQLRPSDEDEELQEMFDQAVEYLITSGMVSEEQLEAWLEEGVTAEEIISYYRKVAEEGEGADGEFDVDDVQEEVGEAEHDDREDYEQSEEEGLDEEGGDPTIEGTPQRHSPQKQQQQQQQTKAAAVYNNFDDDDDDDENNF